MTNPRDPPAADKFCGLLTRSEIGKKPYPGIMTNGQPVFTSRPFLYDFAIITYSTTTIPFAVKRISFSGFVIAAISSFDFFASSA